MKKDLNKENPVPEVKEPRLVEATPEEIAQNEAERAAARHPVIQKILDHGERVREFLNPTLTVEAISEGQETASEVETAKEERATANKRRKVSKNGSVSTMQDGSDKEVRANKTKKSVSPK